MSLKSYLFFWLESHKDKLHVFACIENFAEIVVCSSVVFNVCMKSVHGILVKI